MKSIGILFDLDGTLLDTLQDLLDATNYALAASGYPKTHLEALRLAVGNGAANQIRRSLPVGTPEGEVEKVLALYKAYYAQHCQNHTAPYPGLPAALAQLKEKYPLAIVSNKPDAAVKPLCTRFFPGLFALGEVPGCPRKPDPAMVTLAMKELGVNRCIYVGDSEVDILTGKNAGVPVLSVLWGFRNRKTLEDAGGTHFCISPGELPLAIDRLVEAGDTLL